MTVKKYKILFSDRAFNSFRRVVTNANKASLIGGEDTRSALLKEIRRLSQNPYNKTEAMPLPKMDNEYRQLRIWDFVVVFKIKGDEVHILDMMIGKDVRRSRV